MSPTRIFAQPSEAKVRSTKRIKLPPATGVTISNIDFLCHAFQALAANEVFWVTGIAGDPLDAAHYQWGGFAAPPGFPRYIRTDTNNYVAVSSFKCGEDGKHHRRKANFSRMHMVMVDDVGTKVDFAKLALPPSALVETSPDNFQAWYFLDPPESDMAKADRLVKGMIAAGLTADAKDPGMCGVTRYGRLPVGVNGKKKYVEKLGAPFVQRVAVWTPQQNYQLAQIAAAYNVDLAPVERLCRSPSRLLASLERKVALAGRRQTLLALGAPRGQCATDGNIDGDHDTLETLVHAGLYQEVLDDISGAHRITCPWVSEHTDEDPSGTVYFEPSDDNAWRGGFKCHHGHCQERTIRNLHGFTRQLTTLMNRDSK